MTEYKACSRCKQILPYAEFGKHTKSKDGRYSQCFPCRRQARAEYRARHADTIKVEQRANYLKNREARIAYANARVYADLERHARYSAISKKRNHIKIAADSRRRRARIKQNGVYLITTKELYRLYSSKCFYCGNSGKMTVDHVIAIARGGTDSIGNLVPACKSCNSRKRDLTIMEWRKKRETPQPPTRS